MDSMSAIRKQIDYLAAKYGFELYDTIRTFELLAFVERDYVLDQELLEDDGR